MCHKSTHCMLFFTYIYGLFQVNGKHTHFYILLHMHSTVPSMAVITRSQFPCTFCQQIQCTNRKNYHHLHSTSAPESTRIPKTTLYHITHQNTESHLGYAAFTQLICIFDIPTHLYLLYHSHATSTYFYCCTWSP